MERVEIAEGVTLSRIVYGTWRLAKNEDLSAAAIREKVDACLAAGITSFDHADVYGDHQTEGLFGAVLKEAADLREEMEIITKCGVMLRSDHRPDTHVKHYDLSRKHILRSVEQSLKNLSVETIDLFLLHRPDPLMDPSETGEALDDLVASGKVRAVGVSNFSPTELALLQSAMSAKLTVDQIELSLIHHTPIGDGTLASLMREKVIPMAWSPLGGGRLFDRAPSALAELLAQLGEEQEVDPTAIALAFLLHHPSGVVPVIGTNRAERIAKMAAATSVALDRQTWFELYEAARGEPVA